MDARPAYTSNSLTVTAAVILGGVKGGMGILEWIDIGETKIRFLGQTVDCGL